jgi:hypothetical protein
LLPSRERRRRARVELFSVLQLGRAANFISPIDGASGGREAWRGRFARYRAALSR